MAKNTTLTRFQADRSNDGMRGLFRCTPSNREMAPLNTRPFGRDHLTDEERAELEELGLWDMTTESGEPLILGVLNGRFGSGGIVTLNRTLFPDDEFMSACQKKRAEIESWRQSCKAGAPSNAGMGEAGHPDYGSKYRKAVLFLSLEVEKDDTYDRVCHAVGRVAVLNTSGGRDLAVVRKVGGRVGSSLRGYGEGRYTTLDRESPWYEPNPKYHGEDVIIVREFEFDRDPFDMVDDPATPGCWMESVKDKQEASMKLDENGDPIVEETAPAATDVDGEPEESVDPEADDQTEGGVETEEASGDENVESDVDDNGDDSAEEDADESGADDGDGDDQAEDVDPTGETDDSIEVVEAVRQKLTEAEKANAALNADVERQREEIDNLKRELAEAKTKCVEQAKQLRSIGASNAKLEADVSMLTESRERLTEQVAAKDEKLASFAKLERQIAREKTVSDFIAEQKWNPTHPRAARFREKVETMPMWGQATAEQAREFCEYHLGIEKSEKSAPRPEGFKNNVGGDRKPHPITNRLG